MTEFGKEDGLGVLQVEKGITEKQIEELLFYSRTDEAIKRFTSDPERFKDRQAFAEWQESGRTIYTLTDEKGALLGLVWFGKKTLPAEEFSVQAPASAYPFTFAIRLYGPARGKGWSQKLMETTIGDFLDGQTGERGIWLETHRENLAAIKAYQRFGFQPLGETAEKFLMGFRP